MKPPHAATPASPMLVAVFLLSVILPVQFEAGPIRLSLLAGVMLVALIPVLGLFMAGRLGPLLAVDALVGLHVVWAAVALAANSPAQAPTVAGSNVAELLMPYLLARAIIRTRQDFTTFILFSALSVICTLPFAIFESLTGRAILLRLVESLPGLSMPAEHLPDLRLGLDRAQVGFGHAILYGIFCSLSVTLVLAGLQERVPTPLRLGLAALVAAGCVLSLSSGAIGAMALQLVLLAWNRLFAGLRWRWRALAGLCLLAYGVIDLVSARPPLRVLMTYLSFNPQNAFYRGLILEWGLASVGANPVLGIGLIDWARPDFMVSPTVDNFWLLTAMRYGLPGFVLLAAGFGIGLWQVARRDLAGDPVLARLRLAWLVTMAGLSFSLLTVHIWGEAASFVFFLFGAGIWMASPGNTPRDGPRVAPPYTRFPLRPPRR